MVYLLHNAYYSIFKKQGRTSVDYKLFVAEGDYWMSDTSLSSSLHLILQRTLRWLTVAHVYLQIGLAQYKNSTNSLKLTEKLWCKGLANSCAHLVNMTLIDTYIKTNAQIRVFIVISQIQAGLAVQILGAFVQTQISPDVRARTEIRSLYYLLVSVWRK